MLILILFAFVAGIVTILSPCILPILPIVLSGSITGGKSRPYGVVTGFIGSFTFFTLALSAIVKSTGISATNVRVFSVILLIFFGLTLVLPRLRHIFERIASTLANRAPRQKENTSGFWGGVLIGLSLGLVWTPCVGPILASVLTLAATSSVGGEAILITLAYAFGTSIPLLLIVHGGRKILTNVPWLTKHSAKIQQVFGVLMIIVAIGIYFNFDRKFQTYILRVFPSYGTGLTAFENNSFVQKELSRLQKESENSPTGVSRMVDFLSTDLGTAPELIPGGKWFNSEPITLEKLKGKVVLVDFWTYTCINCIRTLPYLKSWHEKYKDKGLAIIGVHTPEFAFEKDPLNLQEAINDFGITYPVMQDNDYATWVAYDNQYWPAKYLVDPEGEIYYSHFGEGAYDQTEKAIQTLLNKIGSDVSDMKIDNPEYKVTAGSREMYMGYLRIEYLSSPEKITHNTPGSYTAPIEIPVNTFALSGTWSIGEEYAAPQKGSRLVLHFDAKDVFLVMRPKNSGTIGSVKLLQNKTAIENGLGKDIKNSIITVEQNRLYELFKLDMRGTHIIELEFLDNNVELYAFTFG